MGLATAREIVLRFPHTKVVIVEKEPDIEHIKHRITGKKQAVSCNYQSAPDC